LRRLRICIRIILRAWSCFAFNILKRVKLKSFINIHISFKSAI